VPQSAEKRTFAHRRLRRMIAAGVYFPRSKLNESMMSKGWAWISDTECARIDSEGDDSAVRTAVAVHAAPCLRHL
jgi:hypothetical protein